MKSLRLYVTLAVCLSLASQGFAREWGEEAYDLERVGNWEMSPFTGIYLNGTDYAGGMVVGGQGTYYLTESLAANVRFDNVFTSGQSSGLPTSLTSAMFVGGQYQLNDMPFGPFYPYAGLNLGLYFASPAPAGRNSTGALIEGGVGAKYYLEDNKSGFFAEARDAIFSDGGVFNLKLAAGFLMVLEESRFRDSDNDGIPDVKDACKFHPEDFDGFQDSDGCPEPDNDNDGVYDINDKCPKDAEDFDKFEDGDGCPEADNDKDGFLDTVDKCPNIPEDMDGFQDSDGCPEPDDDNDHVNDDLDKCPQQPEDFDNFEDNDGCPEIDNDQDRILDVNDDCPDDAETFNGYEDEDGCPDRVPAPLQILEFYEEGYSLGMMPFRAGSVKLYWQDREICRAAMTLSKAKPFIDMDIKGHIWREASAAERELTKRRVHAIRKWFIENGLIPERIRIFELMDTPEKKDSTRVEITLHHNSLYENR